MEVRSDLMVVKFSGKVLSVEDGVITQKINRSGQTVQHDASKLSLSVKIGDVVEIDYRDGKGIVTEDNKGVSQGR